MRLWILFFLLISSAALRVWWPSRLQCISSRRPFSGLVVVAAGPLRDDSGAVYFGAPYYQGKQGPENDQVVLRWSEDVQGTVRITVRIDDPM